MRLIDADALIEYFGMSENYDCENCNYSDFGMCSDSIQVSSLCQALESIDTIEPKKGKWYHAWENEHFDVADWECSECAGIIHKTERTDFCPHCGADMRE